MTPTMFLINIIGGVSLLLYGLRLVRLGVTRGFGVSLRKILEKGTSNRFFALVSGLVVTMFRPKAQALAPEPSDHVFASSAYKEDRDLRALGASPPYE